MRVLVNALSTTNLSGRHVLLGHLRQLSAWTADEHEFVVLHHAANADMACDLGANVTWRECPGGTAHWFRRRVWEQVNLKSLVADLHIDLLFTPAGIASPSVNVPQVVFAQNPWCLVDTLERSMMEHAKAVLQRRAYRRTMAEADMMVFNSNFMRRAYRANAGREERASQIVYQAIDESTHDAARRLDIERRPDSILCVSVMAPHKGAETLIEALAVLRTDYGIGACLDLVGAWPHRGYEERIRRQTEEAGLGEVVTFHGHVPMESLYAFYASARVFCLMTRCESFGIPAVEAQAFGTPVVSSNCCAIPEVCGEGGVFPEPGDARATADALSGLLRDDEEWRSISVAARRNAARFHWETCSRGLMPMFDVRAKG